MAKKTDCVWYRNKLTGAVDGVDKGSAAHRRMATEAVDDAEGVPHLVWEELTGSAIPKVKTVTYKPGMQAEVFELPEPTDRPEHPPEAEE